MDLIAELKSLKSLKSHEKKNERQCFEKKMIV